MIQNLFLQALSGILGIWLAAYLVTGVQFTGDIKTLFAAGLILGVINTFIRPVLNLITMPLRMLTFGLFSLAINMTIVWGISIFFPQLIFQGLAPLFWTTIIIWGLSMILSFFSKGKF